jgi:hypothetical protein
METSHNGEVRILHFSPNVMRTMSSAGHVKRMGQKAKVYIKFWWKPRKERDH